MASGQIAIHSEEVQDFNCNNRVLAGPGAGKTYWLSGQILQILKYGALGTAKKVACITYTHKAAENIRKRIGYDGDRLVVSTIHAFLYAHVITPYFHLIADEVPFNIAKLDGHTEEIKIGHSLLQLIYSGRRKYLAIKFKDFPSLKSYMSKFHWTLIKDNVELKSSANNPSPLIGFGLKDVMAYKKHVWEEKGLMHHDDVLYFTYKLVTKYPSIKKLLVAKFPYILIDEYQDTNSIQHWLFQQLSQEGAKITIIGDRAQSIYRFAGGDISYIKSFHATDMRDYIIEDNRRSSQQIVEFLNVLRSDLKQNSLIKDSFGNPMVLVGDGLDNYKRANLLCNGEQLVSLCWKNSLANALRLQMDDTSTNLLSTLLSDHCSDNRTNFVFNCLNAVENAKLMMMKDAVGFVMKAFDLDKNKISDKKIAFQNLYAMMEKESEYRDGSLKDFYNLINSLRSSPLSNFRTGKIAEFYSNKYLEFAKEVSNNDQDAMHLTIHKAKGLEFDNVIVVFDDADDAKEFLLKTDLERTKDDHRLYYVACSRARHRLFISIPSLTKEDIKAIKEKFGESLDIPET